MRMKFLRIFPDTCASPWCLFSSSTRNIALGSGSRTTAITSIASSLLNRSLNLQFELRCQNHWTVFRDGYRVLEMGTQTSINSYGRPLIIEQPGVRLAD